MCNKLSEYMSDSWNQFDQVVNILFIVSVILRLTLSEDAFIDATVPTTGGWDDYRAYRFVWHATPDTKPTATAQKNADGSVTVHAIWNGATDVARWIVVAGNHPSSLWPAGAADWNGLDTAITLTSGATQFQVIAQGRDGRVLARSATVAVSSGS